MAKSLRSKWRRKCRAVKRVRYGEKELARLKKTLGIDENASKDAEMNDIEEIATVVDAESLKDNQKTKMRMRMVMNEEEEGIEKMDDGTSRVYSKKTLRDQFGNYPVWMNRRNILKHKKGRAKTKKATTKKDKRVTRKEKKKQAKKTVKF